MTGDLDQEQIVRAESATWRDSSLGCPEAGVMYAQALTGGVWLVLSHGGLDYDYRVAGSRATFYTQPDRQEPLERTPLPGLWTTLARVPTPRSEVAAVELDGKVYVLGGFGAGSTANEAYDPATDAWRRLAPIPTPVNHAGAVALDGTIYLIAGFDPGFGPIGTVWAYDPADDIWIAKAELPSIRGALAVAAVDGKIYAIGGRGETGDSGATEVYDPATDTWTSRSPTPTARDHVAVAVVEDKVFVIGGRLGTFARNLVVTESYDPRADTWKRRSPLPTARSGIAGAAFGGRIYIFGGENVEGTFNENERYDPLADTWEAMPPMPTARHGLAAAVVGNRIYVMAGGTTPGGSQSGLNEAYIVLPDGERSAANSIDDEPAPQDVGEGVSAPEETAAAEVRPGLIAYADPQGRIRVVQPDGSSPVTISPREAFSGWPAWSPEGSQVAFSGILSNKEGPPGLRSVRARARGRGRTAGLCKRAWSGADIAEHAPLSALVAGRRRSADHSRRPSGPDAVSGSVGRGHGVGRGAAERASIRVVVGRLTPYPGAWGTGPLPGRDQWEDRGHRPQPPVLRLPCPRLAAVG